MPGAPSIIDSHCHLDRFYHQGRLDEVLQEAHAAGVDRMIAVGTSDDDWKLYADLAEQHSGVIDFTVGLHPCHVDQTWEAQVEQLEAISGLSASEAKEQLKE